MRRRSSWLAGAVSLWVACSGTPGEGVELRSQQQGLGAMDGGPGPSPESDASAALAPEFDANVAPPAAGSGVVAVLDEPLYETIASGEGETPAPAEGGSGSLATSRQRARAVAALTATPTAITPTPDYELVLKTCANSPAPVQGDVLELTLQVAGNAYGWPLTAAGARAPGATDRFLFVWPGPGAAADRPQADELQALKLDLRGVGTWCLESASLRKLSLPASQPIWSWNSTQSRAGVPYVHGHATTGPIRLDNNNATANGSFVRFALPSYVAVVEATQSGQTLVPKRCARNDSRAFYFRTCDTADAPTDSDIEVQVKHDGLFDFYTLPKSGVDVRNEGVDVLRDNWCALSRLQSVKVSQRVQGSSNWRVCTASYHKFDEIIVFSTGQNYEPLWRDNAAHNVDGSYTYVVDQWVDPCPSGQPCLIGRQGFELKLDPRVAKCVAGTNPADNTCNGIDEDCNGVADNAWLPSNATSCVGQCQALATCRAGVEACGAAVPEVPGNGLNDDCDTRTDEVVPRGACTADSQCDAGFVCHGNVCIAPSCTNGVKDVSDVPGQSETGRDCGGPFCKACDGLACEDTCRVGSTTSPDSQATLSFRSGTFTRPTPATYEPAPGKLATAAPNELRWVAFGTKRLALFEGTSMNSLLESNRLDQTYAWTLPAGSTVAVAANAAVAPDGTTTAEVLRYPAGPARGPTQKLPLPAGTWTLTYYARSALDDVEFLPQVRSSVVSSTNSVLAQRAQTLEDGWRRFSTTFVTPATDQYLMALSQTAAWPTVDTPVLRTPDTELWGGQVEARSFPTSFIPTGGGGAARAPDSLRFSSVPAWLNTAMWQFDVRPLFASAETIAAWRHTLVSAADGWDLALVTGSGPGTAKLSARSSATSYASADMVWPRGATLRVTIDPVADRIHFDGLEGGTTSFAVPGLSFSTGSMRIGGAIDAKSEAFAAISEPRRVAQKDGTCTQDPSCTCGNGTLEAGETCDPKLGACSADCQETERTPCADDDQCPTGQVCDDNADRVGGRGGPSYCWPAFCRTDAASACGSEDAPCGLCQCAPSCENAVCGASNSDGCGGKCPATCPERQPGCEASWECGDGFACGMQVGASFGFAADANVCWPSACESPSERLKLCGEGNAVCGKCPPKNECGTRACGADRFGNVCGECAEGQVCSEAGACSDVPHAALPDDVKRRREVPAPNDVGTLPGTFRVDDSGAAQYSIPLEVPPGQAGLAPELALVYQSSTGYAYAGHGWSISGLSAITRCARTFAQDGYARGVRNDSGDAFCLDGARLVAISGPYGADGTEYRTELDSFQKVVSYGGSDAAGPHHFRVWSKDGRIRTYGASDNTRVTRGVKLGAGAEFETTFVSWMLEKVEDRHGNHMRVVYKREVFTKEPDLSLFGVPLPGPIVSRWHVGEMRPLKILYGPDESREVLFEYGTDAAIAKARSFRGGVPRHVSTPIEKITMRVENRNVRQYVFEHDFSPGTWQLKSLMGCAFYRDAEGQGERTQCMPKTRFDYAPQEPAFSLIATTTDEAGHIPTKPDYDDGWFWDDGASWEWTNLESWQAHPLDHDGDGKHDFVQSIFEHTGHNDDDTFLYLRKSRGKLEQQSAFFDLGNAARSRCWFANLVDWNGDGRDDYLGDCYKTKRERDKELRVILSQGDGFVARGVVDTQNRELGLDGDEAKGGDLDGDGLLDLFTRDRFYRNVGGKFADAVAFESDDSAQCSAFDVDGDGVPEALCHAPDGDTPGLSAYVALSPRPGGQFERSAINWPRELAYRLISPGYPYQYNYQAVYPDVNGDGIADIVAAALDEAHPAVLYLGTGTGYEFAARDRRLQRAPLIALDVDGDGMEEFLEGLYQAQAWALHRPYNLRSANQVWTTEVTNIPFTTGYDQIDGREAYARYYQRPFMMDWDGDGSNELVMRVPRDTAPPFGGIGERSYTDPVLQIWRVGSQRQGLLTKVTDGLQKVTTITYDCETPDERTGTCKPKYTAGADCAYPQKCLKTLPKPVVIRHTESGSTGVFRDLANPSNTVAQRVFEYSYADARVDQRGRGWLGFKGRTIKEFGSATELIRSTVLEYDLESHDDALQLYWAAGRPVVTTTRVAATAPTLNGPSSVEFTTTTRAQLALWPAQHGRKFVAPSETRTSSQIAAEGAASPVATSRAIRTFGYDAWGNTTRIESQWNDGRKQVATTLMATRDEDGSSLTDRWLIALPREVTVQDWEHGDRPDAETKSIRETFLYEAHGLPRQHKLFAADGTEEQNTWFEYTAHGNVERVTVIPRDATLQLQSTVYDAQDMFPVSTTSYVGDDVKPIELGFNDATGQLTSRRDHDGALTTWNYDGFGRLRSMTDGVERTTRIDYRAGGDVGARYTVRQSGDQVPPVVTEYNDFAQPIRSLTRHFGDEPRLPMRATVVEYGYDERGRLVTEGVPHLEGTSSPGAHSYTYDNSNRLIYEKHPVQNGAGDVSSVTLTHRYGHLGFSASDPNDLVRWGQVPGAWSAHSVEGPDQPRSIQVMDMRGNLVGAFDALETVTNYVYGAFDRLRSSTTLGRTTKYVRDDFGRVTHSESPDSGAEDTVYDGAGRVRELRRNKGTPEAQLSTYSYDYQGRMDGAVTPDGTYAWHYDGDRTEKSLIGKLDRESLSSETLGNSSTSYRYDGPASALSEIHRKIEGATYSTYFEHDDLGRVETVRYPQAGDDALTAVRYHYHSEFGLVDGIYDGDDLGHALWLLEDVDAFGNPTKVRLRNKLVTTRKYEAATGLPSSMTTTSADGATTYQDERLTYDSRGLLAKRVRDGRSEYYSHDALGRLKTVASTALGVADMAFDYDLRGNLIRKAPPVLRDTDVGELYYTDAAHPHQVMETQDGRSFQYDVHGRQWLRQGTGIAEGRQEIDYTAFDLPREVRNGPDGAPTETTKYQYDASHQRIVQESSASKTTYVGDAYELTQDAQGEEHRLRIPFPDGSSVEMLVDGSDKELLFHSVDHLGSPTLVTAEGARAGVSPVRAKLAYAPFGAVDAQHSERMDPRVKASFTGHEHDATGLINMRGRMFDPALGRFLSADPLVQAPGFSQSWNRYSYVFNSPLGLVDPSGFEAVRTDFENGDSEVVVTETRWSEPSGGSMLANGGLSTNAGNDITQQNAMNLSNQREAPAPSLRERMDELERRHQAWLQQPTALAPFYRETADNADNYLRVADAEQASPSNPKSWLYWPVLIYAKLTRMLSEQTNESVMMGVVTSGASGEANAARALPAGNAGSVVVNRLLAHEAAFAREIVAHRGGTFVGATARSLPGIDGFLNGAAISLKQTQGGLAAVLRHASKAEASAAKAGYSGVEVFIKAPNVSSSQLIDFARGGGLGQIPTQGTVSAINVFTGDGVVRLIGAM